MTETPCITVTFSDETRRLTVADYDAVQRQREDQPLWARRVPPVEKLTAEPTRRGWPTHISDPAAYTAQMRVLIGLDDPS